MENNMIINSKMCKVNVIGEPHLVMDADLSVVCKDGKYGLMHTSCLEGREDSYVNETELILPCEYDNLFFVEIDYMPHLIAVLHGKQGLLEFEGGANGAYEQVNVLERIPCIYDYIEFGRENHVLFLHDGNKKCCYHIEKKRIFTECEKYKELCDSNLLCIDGEKNVLWNTHSLKKVTELETGDVFYLGAYEQGDVFMMKIWDGNEDDFVQQLLFCEYFGSGAHFSSKASVIRVRTKTSCKEPCIIGVEMCFSDLQDVLSINTVNEITKDKHSFEEK